MTPSKTLFKEMLDLLAADATTLAPLLAANDKVFLVTSDFTPARDLDITTLTLAAFTGSTALSPVAGAQVVGYDTLAEQWFIEMIPPAGGWFWECTVTPGAPVLVYGVILTDHAGTVLQGSMKLAVPVRISAAFDTVYVPTIRFMESDLVPA